MKITKKVTPFCPEYPTKINVITDGAELNPKSSSRPLSICLYPDEGHSDPT